MNLKDQLIKMNTRLERIESYTEPPKVDGDTITLGEWLDEWLSYKSEKVKESTLYQYRLMIKNHISVKMKSRPISQIKPMELQKFLFSIKAKRQREHVQGVLFDAFNVALNMELILKNPLQTLEKPRHEKRESKAFDHKQEEKFVKACKKDIYGDMYLIMLYTGIRKGEALALEGRDIDIHNGVINITKTINDLNHVDTPKSKCGIRQTPILPPLLPYIEKYANGSKKRCFPICDTTAHEHFHAILSLCGLENQGFTTHSLRHTFVTRCNELNVPVTMTQKWVGHSDAKLTMNIYTHCNPDFEEEIIENLKRRLNGSKA